MYKKQQQQPINERVVVFITEVIWNHEEFYNMIRLQAANLAQMNLTRDL